MPFLPLSVLHPLKMGVFCDIRGEGFMLACLLTYGFRAGILGLIQNLKTYTSILGAL